MSSTDTTTASPQATAAPTITVVSDGHEITIPDFAALYPLYLTDAEGVIESVHPANYESGAHGACTACGSGRGSEPVGDIALTPRSAFALHTALVLIGDTYETDLAYSDRYPDRSLDLNYWTFAHYLPSVSRQRCTHVWMSRFVQCFTDLADRIARGQLPVPTCTGEELALHIALSYGDEQLGADEFRDFFSDTYEGLPAFPDIDDALGALGAVLLADRDVMLLFHPAFESLEAVEEYAVQCLGLTYLSPQNWFRPFGLPRPVDAMCAATGRASDRSLDARPLP